MKRRPRLTLEAYERGVRERDRAVFAQAITLVESHVPDDAALAQQLIARLSPTPSTTRRVGITGVPGVGKSTFVDELGMRLLAQGKRVAVLAVDPSSSITGGSILGDKTRMARLSLEENAFIRPSPSGVTLGGVARRTRETLLLCEAAGFDVVLVETVGVGQGETTVAQMVDFFLVLALPGSGDELQGIKKGVLELADVIAINKSDGENAARARVALGDVKAALRYLPKRRASWDVRAVAISGQTGQGVDDLWAIVEEHHARMVASGELVTLRAAQQKDWLWALVRERLEQAFRENPSVAARLAGIEAEVLAGTLTATAASDELLGLFETSPASFGLAARRRDPG